MEIRVLRYFLAVAREETISGAAEALHVTQPTLSRQLMDLKKELGGKLPDPREPKNHTEREGVFFRKRARRSLSSSIKPQMTFMLTMTLSAVPSISAAGRQTPCVSLPAR